MRESSELSSSDISNDIIIEDDLPASAALDTELHCTMPPGECERSISRLRYLNNYLRSTMTESQLNGLAHLYFIGIYQLTLTELFMKFTKASRRMHLR